MPDLANGGQWGWASNSLLVKFSTQFYSNSGEFLLHLESKVVKLKWHEKRATAFFTGVIMNYDMQLSKHTFEILYAKNLV